MEWSPQQQAALRDVDDWYRNDRKTKQVFRLFGFAGSGKTTLARHFSENVKGQVRFATFTGKAAHVMMQKGCAGATTIHKLIYIPKGVSKARLRELMEKEAKILAGSASLVNQTELRQLRAEIRREKENASRMGFSLNLESEIRGAALVVIDECSMVSQEMGHDLESFGVPILVLGDPAQLPPIFGKGHYTGDTIKPDVLLTEIHRQAQDNPIIRMASMIRQGTTLPLGRYGESCIINAKMQTEQALGHDIILVGLRELKRACDVKIREAKGFNNPMPMEGDRLMCIRNNHLLGLLNGQLWRCKRDAVNLDLDEMSLHIQDEDGPAEMVVRADARLLRGEKVGEWDRNEEAQSFEYGYAITVHKAQGSQWRSVMLVDQADKFRNQDALFRRRWLYTGVTRAAERITIVRR